ncbi:uncharacterized protein EI90DRAFT_2989707 [Cantharellus anzutake]|uniref:uncharacterized protein n=1 Tax=Cantharellus anzutake TaxID=1750568 RepID=UPI00190598BE|nr:uncharacterized protein EI90DRAFT_2989707 [Cantharellus anzutake]KAF8340448.1 hypothetical protein EI90DRAFT_2989707 [Cantharellus anzutake]
MKILILTFCAVLFLSTSKVVAICAGTVYGIGNVIGIGVGVNRWNIYDNNCKVVDGVTTDLNPCNQPSGIFACSGSPIYYYGYVNSFTGTKYNCGRDNTTESCGSDIISVCLQCVPS